MKKFLPLLLCLLLSIFTVARATKTAHTPAPDTKTAQNEPRGQEADAKTLFNDANKALAAMIKTARDDDDSIEDASDDEGEDMNDDDGGDATGDEQTGDDDGGHDDGGGDASDDSGGDEGE